MGEHRKSKSDKFKIFLRGLLVFLAVVVGILIAALIVDVIIDEYVPEKKAEAKTAYAIEQERYTRMLEDASDAELFAVLRYAIMSGYVPNEEGDPYGEPYVMVSPWERTILLYRRLDDRPDLLKTIYPDLDVLGEYMEWGKLRGSPYPNPEIAATIVANASKDSMEIKAMVGDFFDSTSVNYKYFATPIMWQAEAQAEASQE